MHTIVCLKKTQRTKRPNLKCTLSCKNVTLSVCQPCKGVLLFGPLSLETGKTLIAKTPATEAKAAFDSATAASLTSRIGEI